MYMGPNETFTQNNLERNQGAIQQAYDLILENIQPKLVHIEDDDFVVGEIKGVLDCVPTDDFHVDIKTTKAEFNNYLREALQKELSSKREGNIKSLNRALFFHKATDVNLEKSELGGYEVLV